MDLSRKSAAGLVALILAATFALPAAAKPAKCFTTDDGHYDCNFELLDRDGSFEITAPDYPIFQLQMDRPGVANGYINLGNRYIMMPGFFIRLDDDPACWESDATQARICAW